MLRLESEQVTILFIVRLGFKISISTLKIKILAIFFMVMISKVFRDKWNLKDIKSTKLNSSSNDIQLFIFIICWLFLFFKKILFIQENAKIRDYESL